MYTCAGKDAKHQQFHVFVGCGRVCALCTIRTVVLQLGTSQLCSVENMPVTNYCDQPIIFCRKHSVCTNHCNQAMAFCRSDSGTAIHLNQPDDILQNPNGKCKSLLQIFRHRRHTSPLTLCTPTVCQKGNNKYLICTKYFITQTHSSMQQQVQDFVRHAASP